MVPKDDYVPFNNSESSTENENNRFELGCVKRAGGDNKLELIVLLRLLFSAFLVSSHRETVALTHSNEWM